MSSGVGGWFFAGPSGKFRGVVSRGARTEQAERILAYKSPQTGMVVARPRVSTNHDINLSDDHPEFSERGIGRSQLPLTSS